MDLKVLVVQNSAIIGNKNATLNNVDALLAPYKGKKFDIIVLPEVFSVGWYCSCFPKEAEYIDNSITIDFLKNIAMSFNATVVGGSFIQKFKNNTYKNTCPVISAKGQLVTTYDKMHLFSHKGSEENKYISTGNELKILDLGFTKIGLSICYDIRFPEIYRKYSKEGAQVIINVAAWSDKKPEHWEIMHRARAIENQCFMIVADQTGKICGNENNLGHSMIINPWGDIVARLEAQEACFEYTINLDEVSNLRQNFPLLADRRDEDFESFNIKEIKINA